ncbi:MAG: stage III sporulation protein AA [Lachnospiraceae bacterium]
MEKIKKNQILQVLASSIQRVLEQSNIEFEEVEELRLRSGKPLVLIQHGEEHTNFGIKQKPYIIKGEEIRETMEYISHYSLYAYEHEMKRGYLTIEGGHRIGIAGKIIMEGDKIKNLQYISSINIRVAHEVLGCADSVFPLITYNKQIYHTLIISPPRCGKTTLLRDMVRQISDGNKWVKGCTVGVVDERSEIGGCYMGVSQNELGMRTDVLDCCPKAEGMIMLIRSMAPQVIAVDEIGAFEDVHAIEYAIHCGCKMLASAHGMSMVDIRRKPFFDRMIKEQRFERYIVLDNQGHIGHIQGIYDERGVPCM